MRLSPELRFLELDALIAAGELGASHLGAAVQGGKTILHEPALFSPEI